MVTLGATPLEIGEDGTVVLADPGRQRVPGQRPLSPRPRLARRPARAGRKAWRGDRGPTPFRSSGSGSVSKGV
ncbi:hypothetical protein OG792_09025 [Micromonospora sp. NBC_01699]